MNSGSVTEEELAVFFVPAGRPSVTLEAAQSTEEQPPLLSLLHPG